MPIFLQNYNHAPARITVLTFSVLVKLFQRKEKHHCCFKGKTVCYPFRLLGRKQIWIFEHERYHSEKVLNEREHKLANENAILTLNTLVQQDCNEMIMWLLCWLRRESRLSQVELTYITSHFFAIQWPKKPTKSIISPHENFMSTQQISKGKCQYCQYSKRPPD